MKATWSMAYGHIKWVSELSKPWKLSPREQYQVQIKYWLWDRRGKVIPWTLSCKSFSVLLSNVYSLNYILRCNKSTCQRWPATSLTSGPVCSASSGWAEGEGGREDLVKLFLSAYLWVTFACDTHCFIQNPPLKNCRSQINTTWPATYLEFRKSSLKEEFRLRHAWNFSLL